MKYLKAISAQCLSILIILLKHNNADNITTRSTVESMLHTDENITDLLPAIENFSRFHILTPELPFYTTSNNDLRTTFSRRRITRLSDEIAELKTQLRHESKNECKWKHEDDDCYPPNCAEAMKEHNNEEGMYMIKLPGLEPFQVICEKHDPQRFKNGSSRLNNLARINEHNENGPWTIIQRRTNAEVNFNRNWNGYKQGFGYEETDFFLGLEKIYRFTYFRLHELWIELKDFDCLIHWARYSHFTVDSEENNYAILILGNYSGNAGNALGIHGGQMFSTPDRDNDHDRKRNCALVYQSGWWFRSCFLCNLNGVYKNATYAKDTKFSGIVWETISEYTLQRSQMAIRPTY